MSLATARRTAAYAGLLLTVTLLVPSDSGSSFAPTVAAAPAGPLVPATVSGYVTDQRFGKPIAAAVITTNPALASLFTNNEGMYALSFPAVFGVLEIRVRAPHFQTRNTCVRLKAGSHALADLIMARDGDQANYPEGCPVTTDMPEKVDCGPFSRRLTDHVCMCMPGFALGASSFCTKAGPGTPPTALGMVRDGRTSAPIANATIRTHPPTMATQSNGQGHYVLAGLAPGTSYSILVERSGYFAYSGAAFPARPEHMFWDVPLARMAEDTFTVTLQNALGTRETGSFTPSKQAVTRYDVSVSWPAGTRGTQEVRVELWAIRGKSSVSACTVQPPQRACQGTYQASDTVPHRFVVTSTQRSLVRRGTAGPTITINAFFTSPGE